ncbi:MAG: sensor histidine kinase [Bacillota bacterium]
MNLLTQASIIANRTVQFGDTLNTKSQREELNHMVKSFSKEIDSRVMILNSRGVVISDSYDEFVNKRMEHEEVTQALDGKSAAKEYDIPRYRNVMYVTYPIWLGERIDGAVFISSSLKDIYDSINKNMLVLFALSLISIIITGIISIVFAHIFSMPIQKLTDGITKMAQGNLEQRVEISGSDELANLGSAFNMMSTKLAQVDQQRKDFVANVSHELRTPLSAIKLLSESLLHQDDVDVKTYKEFLGDIDAEVNRLNTIIESLLALVDIDKGKLELNYQITYVNYLIENVLRRLKPLADKKNIDLIFYGEEKIQIQLDQIKIHQALTNIIYNGIKYTGEGGRVEISLYSESNDAVIKIEDNGIGIPEESLPYIFERFYRVDKARARRTGGTGLGLAITQQIIGLHQGKIEVTSQLNQGTIFTIKLPKDIGLGS